MKNKRFWDVLLKRWAGVWPAHFLFLHAVDAERHRRQLVEDDITAIDNNFFFIVLFSLFYLLSYDREGTKSEQNAKQNAIYFCAFVERIGVFIENIW